MTVAQLILKLQQLSPNTLVVYPAADGGYHKAQNANLLVCKKRDRVPVQEGEYIEANHYTEKDNKNRSRAVVVIGE